MKPKLCYVLSNYNPDSVEHYYHLHELLTYLSKFADIYLLAESGQTSVVIEGINNYYVQRYTWLPLRLLERMFILLKIYFLGYRKFYCHYADLSTIMSATITRIFGGTTYKWHCAQEHYYQTPPGIKHLKEKIIRELPFSLSIKIANFIVTGSPQMKHYYHAYYHVDLNKIIVIPNFINLRRFKPISASKFKLKRKLSLPNLPIALYVHHMSQRKGADRLIAYAQTIKDQNLNFCIVAVGSGPLLNQLQAQAIHKHLSSQIIFLGSIPNKLLSTYFQASNLLIVPSRIEEFARVQLEAMASGLPIIATDTLATKAMFINKQQHFVVPQSKHHQIPLLALKLLSDRKLYQQLVKIGLEHVQEYSLPKIAHLYRQHIISH